MLERSFLLKSIVQYFPNVKGVKVLGNLETSEQILLDISLADGEKSLCILRVFDEAVFSLETCLDYVEIYNRLESRGFPVAFRSSTSFILRYAFPSSSSNVTNMVPLL